MYLREFTNISIRGLIGFFCTWIFTLYLNRPEDKRIIHYLGNDKVETFITVWEINIPSRVRKPSCNMEFSEVIRNFHHFSFRNAYCNIIRFSNIWLIS